MGFQCGIVGLPNVGKSTIFNALTSAKAEAANYPFCTIDPNTGIVKVPDPRLADIQKYIPTDKLVPAVMTFVDIAGLVKGASKGEGLGNQFLGHIRETNAIAHVVRCFGSERGPRRWICGPHSRHRRHRHGVDLRGSRNGQQALQLYGKSSARW